MAESRTKNSTSKLRKRAERYFAQCDAAEQAVTIGGFCRALDITLDTLRRWSEQRREDAAQYVFLDCFWTRYFAAAEADLNEKETQAAAKFRLERLMPLFEGRETETVENGISVQFADALEPYSR